MRPLGIELHHLRYFIAAAELGSLRAASLHLHISQPPLTRQLQQLERAVGTTLLIRSAKGVDLSDAGREFYVQARNILALTLRAVRQARLVGHGHTGRLDIGVFGSPIFDMVPRIVGAFDKRNPGVEVALHTLNRSDQLKALRERRIDVGFNRFIINESGLRWETIETQELKVAVVRNHLLASKQTLTLAELVAEELIFYPRSPRPGFMDHVLGLFARQGLVPQQIVHVDDVPTAIAMVASGRGLTIVPSSASNLRLPNVEYKDLAPSDNGTVESCMIYRDEDASILVQKFLETAREDYRSSRSR